MGKGNGATTAADLGRALFALRDMYAENPKAITLRSELRQKTFNRSRTGRGDC